MLTSHFRVRHRVSALLLELPGVTTALEARSSDALARLTDLLTRAEQQLLHERLRQAADLAACRAAIAAARLEGATRGKAKAAERQAALGQIGAIRTALAEAVARSESAIDAALPAVRQLLQLVGASGALRLNGRREPGELAGRIWDLASQHEQLKPLALQLRVLLDRHDILLLLADEMDLADFEPDPAH